MSMKKVNVVTTSKPLERCHPGARFGKLTVLSRVKRTRYPRYRVRCDCGVEKEVVKSSLVQGGAKTCGCSRIKLKPGDQCEDWTVLYHAAVGIKKRRNYWRVQCKCGRESMLPTATLTGRHSRRCRSCAMRLVHARNATGSHRRSKKINACVLKAKTAHITLKGGTEVVIDREDYDRVRDYNWFLTGVSKYAAAWQGKNKPRLLLHYVIMNHSHEDSDKIVRHRNGNVLDCRKVNLEIVSMSEGLHQAARKRANNTSGYIGVTWNKQHDRWQSKITVDYKQVWLGLYDDPRQAARAYDQAKTKYFGAKAPTNKSLGYL